MKKKETKNRKALPKAIMITGKLDGKRVSLSLNKLRELTGVTEHTVRKLYYAGVSHQSIIDACVNSDEYKAMKAEHERMKMVNWFLFRRFA